MKRNMSGWIKDKRDERDFYSATCPVRELPDKVDLSSLLPPVRDQGQVGSCVGFGIGGNVAGMSVKAGIDLGWFSPTWIYNGARAIEGTLNQDNGCHPRDALDYLVHNGCLLEALWPYNPKVFDWHLPNFSQITAASTRPLLSYQRCVDGIAGICSALADGNLVSIGSPWYQSWFTPNPDGALSKPNCCSKVAGGHETLLYGYDRASEMLMGQNSWGTSWGKGGRYLMPFSAISMFKTRGYGYDAHVLTINWTS